VAGAARPAAGLAAERITSSEWIRQLTEVCPDTLTQPDSSLIKMETGNLKLKFPGLENPWTHCR